MAAVFRHTHRVTYSDCTLGNHVYYGRYLPLLEAARAELFRTLGTTFLEWQEQDTIFPVIECRLQYRAPARYDEVLTIETSVSHAAGVRLNFDYRIVNQGGKEILRAETSHVCTGLAEKPKRLPAQLLQSLEPWLPNPAKHSERA